MQKTANTLNPQNWISNYADELYGYAISKTGIPELAEDLVQETFLAGLKAADNFKGESSERTWLYSILKFKIAAHYRKASTRREVRLSEDQGCENSTDIFFTNDGSWKPHTRPKEWGIDFSCHVENRELSATLEKCIEKLNSNQKQLVVLKLIEEIEVEKICKELEITTTNYWVIIHRAKLQLRACLEQNWLKI